MAAIACMAGAAALYSVFDALAKWLVADYSPVQILFFRAVFGLLPWALLAHLAGGLRAAVVTRQPHLQVLRGVLAFTATACFVMAFRHMVLANAVAIAYAAPILITALSVPLLGEAVGLRRWSAIAVGFLGVLVLVRPGPGTLDSGALWALMGTGLYSLSGITTRRLGARDRSVTTMFYSASVYLLLGGVLLPFVWRTPEPAVLLGFASLGLVAGIAQFLMVQAYRLGPAATVSPFEYSILAWAVVWGLLVWREVPDGWSVLGMAIIVTAGLYIARRERAVRRSRSG